MLKLPSTHIAWKGHAILDRLDLLRLGLGFENNRPRLLRLELPGLGVQDFSLHLVTFAGAREGDSCGVRTHALAEWRLKPAP